MRPTERTAPKHRSLKWSAVGMMLLCWILPVVLAMGGLGGYLLYTLNEQGRQTLQASTQNALELVEGRLESATVASRRASYIPTIRTAWHQYRQDGNEAALYREVKTLLYQQYKYDEKFISAAVTFCALPDQSFYVASNAAVGGDGAALRRYESEVKQAALELSPALGTQITFLSGGGSLYMVRNLVDTDYQPYAVLVMELNGELLFRDLAGLAGVQNAVLSLDQAQITLCGQPEPMPPPIAQGVRVSRSGEQLTVQAGSVRDDYILSFYAEALPPELGKQKTAAYLTMLAITLLSLPLMVLMFWFFSRKVSRPVAALMRAAEQIREGMYGVQVDPAAMTSSEMASLGDSFNTMSSTLKNQFDHIYKEELALRDARIMALQSQINPHFLNNTLEIINWEARMAGDLKVCSMLESLSTMLEAAMDRRHRPLVHLSEELMYVDAYLYIINERLGRRLNVRKEIDQGLLDVYVPRLILQPILENAVEHGINPLQKGTIALRAYQQGRWLVLEVENNGATTPEDKARIRALLSDEPAPEGERSGSLGIRNVHQRLRILYGEESGLFVNFDKKDCTIFSMKIDLAQNGQN